MYLKSQCISLGTYFCLGTYFVYFSSDVPDVYIGIFTRCACSLSWLLASRKEQILHGNHTLQYVVVVAVVVIVVMVVVVGSGSVLVVVVVMLVVVVVVVVVVLVVVVVVV